MHLQTRDAHKEAWPSELLLLIVIAQHVTNVLAQKTFDALAKLLHAIDFTLIHLPFHVWLGCERRNLFVNAIVPRNIGNEILEHRKALHRLYGNWLVKRHRIESSLTSQPRVAVVFGRARTALAGFAVPAHGQVASQMPTRIEQTRAVDVYVGCAVFQLLNLRKTLLEILFTPKDAHVRLHRLLQVSMHIVRAVTVAALKRREHFIRSFLNLSFVNVRRSDLFRVFGCSQTGAATKDEKIRERISAQPIRAMQPCGRLTGSKQSRHIRFR